MKASRTFPLSMYSRLMVMSAESCHILQYGHWKSLAMIIQILAAGLPRIRALSARTTIGSVDTGPVAPAAAGSVAGVAGEAVVADFSATGVVVARAFSVPLHATLATRAVRARKRMEWVMREKIPPGKPARLRPHVCGASAHAHRAYVLHPRALELAHDAGDARYDDDAAAFVQQSSSGAVSRSVRVRASRTTPVSLTGSEGSCANSRGA